MLVIGIDPGLDGGAAVIDDVGEYIEESPYVVAMPTIKVDGKRQVDIRQLVEMFGLGIQFAVNHVVIERVHAMPKQGVTSMFTFGMGYGKILGMMETFGITYETVLPQKWKNLILAGTKKDKAAAIKFAKRKYKGINLKATPRCKTDHDGMADAVCLAHYALRRAYEEEARTAQKKA